MKFIPEADGDFAFVAQSVFLSRIKPDPGSHGLTTDDVACIDKAVTEFRDALAKSLHKFSRTQRSIMEKDEARAKAEEIVRRYANIIRANPNVSDTNKRLLRLKPRTRKLKKRECPAQPPRLQFLGSGEGVGGGIAEGSGSGIHVLAFFDARDSTTVSCSDLGVVRRAKPDGAVRIELYFDMIPPGEPVPEHPAERGWPKYLRSFTRSPMDVEYPIPSEPMLIVYWARWADSTGQTGRWSATCVARVEGWTAFALPEGSSAQRVETKYVIVHAPYQLPDHIDSDEEVNGRRGRLLPEARGKYDVSRRFEAAPFPAADPKQTPL